MKNEKPPLVEIPINKLTIVFIDKRSIPDGPHKGRYRIYIADPNGDYEHKRIPVRLEYISYSDLKKLT